MEMVAGKIGPLKIRN